jgi:tripeptide aminopeptidase
MQNVIDRFIKYVKYDTKSDEETNTVPSTPGQLVLARILGNELEEIGMSDVTVDDNGYVMATLPSNITRNVPVIGFIAHMDTSPDMSGTNVNPIIIEDYNGKDLVLNSEKNIVTTIKDFPELKNYIGKALIVTDGTTLLGADDKAGIAEIITAMEFLLLHPEIEHGTIRIGFTPDEEIGNGADHFDVKKFNADFAYTLDGGPIGELEYENFNAAGVKISIQGTSVHPGSAKNKMINSMLIANEFISSLPEDQVPSKTEGYEGFYHLVGVNGNVELTTLHYIIRDFDLSSFKNRKATLQSKVDALNLKYGSEVVNAVISDQYFNMREIIEKHMYIVDTAYKAMEAVDVVPLVKPIRGGTDGSRLSYMGLPTPNIFTGGHNFHGKHEFIPTYAMEKAVEVILKVVELFAN